MSDQIRSIFARWQTLEAEKAATSEGLRELFTEAKGNGFDAKALRLAFRERVKSSEPETDADRATRAMVDTYLAALGTPVAITRVARNVATAVKAAAEESGAARLIASPSHEEDGAHRKVSAGGGSRQNTSGESRERQTAGTSPAVTPASLHPVSKPEAPSAVRDAMLAPPRTAATDTGPPYEDLAIPAPLVRH